MTVDPTKRKLKFAARTFADFDDEPIVEASARLRKEISTLEARLQSADISEDDAEIEPYELGVLESRVQTLNGLAFVLLYSEIELAIKLLLRIASKGKITPQKLFKFKEQSNQIQSFNVTMSKVDNFSEFDEIRNINNAFKHSRRVSADLAKFPHWTGRAGSELDALDAHYERLRDPGLAFIQALAVAIEAQIP